MSRPRDMKKVLAEVKQATEALEAAIVSRDKAQKELEHHQRWVANYEADLRRFGRNYDAKRRQLLRLLDRTEGAEELGTEQ